MRRLVTIAAIASFMVGALATGERASAAPMPNAGIAAVAGEAVPLDKTQYAWGGRRYCWYPGGWRGPGWYWCGNAWRRGFGWGGGYGWHGWGGPRAYAWRGGGWRGPGWHGGGWHGGGWHGGGWHGGGWHGGGGRWR